MGIASYLIWKKISKLGMVLAYTIWNPLVTAPIYSVSYQLGDLFFSKNSEITYTITWFAKVLNFTQRFLLGAGIIALIASCICYWLTLYSLTWYKKLKFQSIKHKPEDLEAISSASELDPLPKNKKLKIGHSRLPSQANE